jgi:hypothetical protein
MKRLSLGLVASIVILGVSTVSAQRKDTEPSTVALNPPSATAAATTGAWPALGDWVTFSATFPKQLESKSVRIQVMCYQDGALVYGAAASYTDAQQLGGGMSDWYLTGGPASCVATLYYWTYNRVQRFNWLAETHFDAADRQ